MQKLRIKEIDFLRGIAILLVVFYHYPSILYLNKIGFIGVDLFFVLSGYLISSLLLKEYLKFGNVNSILFLIRRGFKIYPLFYFFIFLTIIIKYYYRENISLQYLLGELTFTRNYLGGFWAHTWTLCVEEHFYFFIALAMLFINKNILHNVKKINKIFIYIFLGGILMQLINVFLQIAFGENYFFNTWARRVQTQYNFDSLLYGVFISYNLIFNKNNIETFFKKYSLVFTITSIIIIMFIPIIENEYFFPFRDTLLYISFGNILLLFVTGVVSFSKIKFIVFKIILNIFTKIGVYSYSIYLFHPFIRYYIILKHIYIEEYKYSFFVYLFLSILSGILFTKIIELPMLVLRDKYFPARR